VAAFVDEPEAIYLPPGVKTRNVSDGYHTFDELYMHRLALTVVLFTANRRHAWKSKQHHPDGDPMFGGFFIVGMDLPDGTVITYHYKLEYWDLFERVPEITHAPAWDGHSPNDVIDRLLKYAKGEK
jgi:hypothetical protein